MENWTTVRINELKKLYSECIDEEIALSRYTGCMIRLVNGMAQMYYSQFHHYEFTILWRAMDIFTSHFIEQISLAKKELEVYKKRELVDDIENAVDRMTGVYQNVINSMANSDRQMLSGISVDSSIYELSPKLCAFYSEILNDLVTMFGEENDYAFILHPTLKNNTETQIMFDKREKSGKVVIIYISESIIEETDIVSVFLLHEAFHVLTKERLRKVRLGYYIQMLLSAIKQMLFHKVQFSDNEDLDEEMKESLMRKCFCTINTESNSWKKRCERDFYGDNVINWSVDYFYNRLDIISEKISGWIEESNIWKYDEIEDYEIFKKMKRNESDIINMIHKNIKDIIMERKVIHLAEEFMFICRETYADIACVLLLELEPDAYENAFAKSKQFKYDKTNFCDTIMEFRDYIVTRTATNYLPDPVVRQWKNRKVCHENILQIYKDNGLTSDRNNVMIAITSTIEDAFCDYINQCARAFLHKINNTAKVEFFRKKMEKVRSMDKGLLLTQIMSGDFENMFSE